MATTGIFTRIFTKIVHSSPQLRQKCYEISYFPQLGLMSDDCVAFDHPYVKEAILRLPKEVREERQFRIIRATTLSAKSKILPKSEWMTIEQDKPYIQDVIEEIRAEHEEKAKIDRFEYAYQSKRSAILDREAAH